MENYRKTSHAIYDIKYHLVWITKYRKIVLTGKIGERTREIITIESLLDETGYTSDYAPTQIKKLQNILDERGCVIVKK